MAKKEKMILIKQITSMMNHLYPVAVKNSSIEGIFDKNHILDLIINDCTKARRSDPLEFQNWWSYAYLNGKKDKEEYDFIMKDSLSDLLAGIIVRIMILSKSMNLDLEEAIKAKIKYNKERKFDYAKEN